MEPIHATSYLHPLRSIHSLRLMCSASCILSLAACQIVLVLFSSVVDTGKEREIIRLWNWLRLLEKEGRRTAAVRRLIEKALAEREHDAA
jgi:hypothetical protein